MTNINSLAISAAVFLCIASTFFGVAMARLFWADDLRHAKNIDMIRSQTEQHLRGEIEHLTKTIEVLKARLSKEETK